MEIIKNPNFNMMFFGVGTAKRFALPFDAIELERAILFAYDGEMQLRGIKTQIDDKSRARIETIAKWLTDETERVGLLMYGDVGTGKTTALRAIRRVINCATRKEYNDITVNDDSDPFAIVTAKEIVRAFTDDPERYKRMTRAEMLGVDELGTESTDVKSFGNVSAPVIDLLSERYDRQRMTIVSSNCDMKDITAKYGLRMADRFNEMFKRVAFVGDSFRGYAKNGEQ